jgi:hypothetical protein
LLSKYMLKYMCIYHRAPISFFAIADRVKFVWSVNSSFSRKKNKKTISNV